MGLTGHVAEIEYHFGSVDATEMRDTLQEVLIATKYFNPNPNKDKMFRRPGDEHDISHVHLIRDSPVDDSMILYATCTSPMLGFVDDIAFSINAVDSNLTIVKGLSISRIGESDFYKNKKNLKLIIRGLREHYELKKQTIIRS